MLFSDSNAIAPIGPAPPTPPRGAYASPAWERWAVEFTSWALTEITTLRVAMASLGTDTERDRYTITNRTTDRALDCNSTTLDEVADVLGTLIADLQGGDA